MLGLQDYNPIHLRMVLIFLILFVGFDIIFVYFELELFSLLVL